MRSRLSKWVGEGEIRWPRLRGSIPSQLKVESRWLHCLYKMMVSILSLPAMPLSEAEPFVRRATKVLLVVFNVVFVINAASDYIDALQFVREGGVVRGEVVKFLPEDHYTLAFKYVIRGIVYRGRQPLPYSGSPVDCRPGARVDVYYTASNPGNGKLDRPVWHPVGTLMQWIAFQSFLLLPYLFVVVLHRNERQLEKRLQPKRQA